MMLALLATLSWWLVIQLIGLAALPLAHRVFGRLPSRGYALAKALGLLLAAYVLWMGATFRLLPNDIGGAVVAVLVVAGLSGWLGREGLRRENGGQGGRPLFRWLRDNRWTVLAVELLFLGVFAAWTAFRAYNPDIAGTEKPMELAFVNGVLGSRFFPPQDPWLAGYSISYYYFGYVMLGLLIRLTGVDPAQGFNLAVALWYALVMIGAFSLAYDLVRPLVPFPPHQEAAGDGGQARDPAGGPGRAIRYGLLGALFVGFLGNLEGLVDAVYQRALVPLDWIRWLDIKQLTDAPPSGGWTGGFWWWWRASRVIHDRDLLGNSVEVIDEFPFFSFLLGDMHPHVLGLPFVLLAIALALSLLHGAHEHGLRRPSDTGANTWSARAREFWRWLGDISGMGSAGVLLGALLLGGLAFLNTWDFPIYVALAALAAGAGLGLSEGLTRQVVGRTVGTGIVLGALGWLLYLPFFLGFQSQLGGILPNLLFPTRLRQFALMFGPFLAIAVFFMVLLGRVWAGRHGPRFGFAGTGGDGETGDLRHSTLRAFLLVLPCTLLAPLVLWGLVILGLLLLPQGRELVQSFMQSPAVQANVPEGSISQLLGLVVRLRVTTPWTYLLLSGLIAWAAALLWVRLRSGDRLPGEPPAADVGLHEGTRDLRHDIFGLLMIGLALSLALFVEFLYLRDLFGTRMNTVFKFYYQAWILLALTSTYALSRLAGRGVALALKIPAVAISVLLILGGLFYPLAAIPSKADYFRGQPTLDGLAYLRRFNPADMAAIDWLRAHVPSESVVLEASGGSYSPEGAGRVSMATGNPTLLGWDFHEMQWRGQAYGELSAGRPEALDQIYRTARPEELPGLLDRWGIDYVYVGGLERNKYGIGDLRALQRLDSALNRVYDADGVVIYAK